MEDKNLQRGVLTIFSQAWNAVLWGAFDVKLGLWTSRGLNACKEPGKCD